MKKLFRFGFQRTIINVFYDVNIIYLIPTIELAIDREWNRGKPNKINIVSISLSWLKWDLYMNLYL